MWAEEFALGEMGLSPDAFWSLTVREFWIKHSAFRRSEDRNRALVLELALRTTNYKKKDQHAINQTINALRRYPIKKWLMSE